MKLIMFVYSNQFILSCLFEGLCPIQKNIFSWSAQSKISISSFKTSTFDHPSCVALFCAIVNICNRMFPHFIHILMTATTKKCFENPMSALLSSMYKKYVFTLVVSTYYSRRSTHMTLLLWKLFMVMDTLLPQIYTHGPCLLMIILHVLVIRGISDIAATNAAVKILLSWHLP